MKLTIGMAVHGDYDGAFFTVQALRMYHSEVMRDTEIVIIDNDPGSPSGKALQETAGWWYGATAEAKAREGGGNATLGGFQYHALASPVGTSSPRQKIFDVAKGDYVLCMDCHVLLEPGGLRRLLDWWAAHPESNDLLTGPLVYYGLDSYSTHFDDVWRDQMWGTWAQAWRCHNCPQLFSCLQIGDGRLGFTELMARYPTVAVIDRCPACKEPLPTLAWSGHERELKRLAFEPLAEDADGAAFEIPAQGLGLFACRRDAWLGFNDKFRGFGGEEWYIHEKFRKAGRKCLCLPSLRWMHRFTRPNGVTYPLNLWNKIRNYVIGHAELGLPMDRLRSHFLDAGVIPKHEWDELMADPLNPPELPRNIAAAPQAAPPPAPGAATGPTLEDRYAAAWKTPSDINEHVPKLRELATGCDLVVEFGMRPDVSTIALLAGQPRRFVHYDFQESLTVDIDPCDLLFIDTKHTASHLTAELARHAIKVRRWLVFHDTQIFGERGEDGQPGLLRALGQFTVANPEWFVAYHTPTNNGLTVLGRQPADRPSQTIWAWPPGKGPGTELKAILVSLGVNPGADCDCNSRSLQMDFWGVEGSRSHREEIIGWLRDGQGRWGWKEKLTAAANAVRNGVAFKLNPLDPFPGLVDESIRRAESKEKVVA